MPFVTNLLHNCVIRKALGQRQSFTQASYTEHGACARIGKQRRLDWNNRWKDWSTCRVAGQPRGQKRLPKKNTTNQKMKPRPRKRVVKARAKMMMRQEASLPRTRKMRKMRKTTDVINDGDTSGWELNETIRKEAFEKGLIRPWVMLTMTHRERQAIAGGLGLHFRAPELGRSMSS